MRIGPQVELCRTAFKAGNDELLDRIEADGTHLDGLGDGDQILLEDLHQAQDLNELALALVAHPRFQQPA